MLHSLRVLWESAAETFVKVSIDFQSAVSLSESIILIASALKVSSCSLGLVEVYASYKEAMLEKAD